MYKKKTTPIIIFILLLLGMSIFSYLPAAIFKIDLNKLSNSMKIAYEFSCNLGFMIIIFMLYQDIIIDNLKKYLKEFKKNFKLSFSYYIVGLIIMIISNNIISIFFSEATASNEQAVRSLIDLYPLYMLFSVSIYAPFVEELIFRKSIKDCVLAFGDNKITKYLYIIISGLIFSSLHVLGTTSSFLDYLYIIPYLALGISFAALYYKTDNIFTTITMHSLHNTIAILLYILVGV